MRPIHSVDSIARDQTTLWKVKRRVACQPGGVTPRGGETGPLWLLGFDRRLFGHMQWLYSHMLASNIRVVCHLVNNQWWKKYSIVLLKEKNGTVYIIGVCNKKNQNLLVTSNTIFPINVVE